MKKTASLHPNGTAIQQELLRALRYRRPLSLLSVSADFSGATSLATGTSRMETILRRHLRSTDTVEEDTENHSFILLPETMPDGALVMARRIVKDLVRPSGAIKNLYIGISGIDDGIYRADDLMNTAILSGEAARTCGNPIFSVRNFLDKREGDDNGGLSGVLAGWLFRWGEGRQSFSSNCAGNLGIHAGEG